mmetsp:Transcript_4095/g.13001  ORF Transcript_4095/g.13001 Transcript_4095/m.13001 type:complete len:215 (-) Transcript_4095:555-1199(-)
MFADDATPESPRSACDGAADGLASGSPDEAPESPNLVELAPAEDLPRSRRASEVPPDGGRRAAPLPRGHTGPPSYVACDARASLSGIETHDASPGRFQPRFSRSENYRPGASWSASVLVPTSRAGGPPATSTSPFTAVRGDLPARPSVTALLPPPAPMAAKVGHSPPLTGSLDSEFDSMGEEWSVGISLPLLPPPMRPFTRPAPLVDSDDDVDE